MSIRLLSIVPLSLVVFSFVFLSSCSALSAQDEAVKPDSEGWIPLFNGKNLEGWKTPNFGGEAPSVVKNEELIIEMGSPMNGLVYTKEFPKTNYEVELKARRLLGGDFFVGLTFPVSEDYLSFVVGGWGGAVVGVSSLDGEDANNNKYRVLSSFKEGQWYKVNVRVTPEEIKISIDDKQIIAFDPRKYELTTRPEVDLCKPFGLATYETEAGYQYIKYRRLESASKP